MALAIVGAIVGEMVGANSGLGYFWSSPTAIWTWRSFSPFWSGSCW